MRTLKYFLIVVIVFFGYLAITDAVKGTNRSDDAEWFAQIWDYAIQNGDGRTVPATFDAIEQKHETIYIPALQKFLTHRRRTSPYRAKAIYTLHKLGSVNAENDFNLLLMDKTRFETQLWPSQTSEKFETLKYMHELKLKPGKIAIEEIKKDIFELDKMGYSDFVLRLIGGLKLHGVELTDEQRQMISEHISHNLRRFSSEDLIMSGIQLDWEEMFATQHKRKERHNPRFFEMYEIMLASLDEESRARFAEGYDANSDEKNDVNMFRTIMGATVGDKDAIDRIVNDLHYHLAYHCMPVSDLLPDEVLVAIFDFVAEQHNGFQPELLEEMDKRGYEQRVTTFLNECESIAREQIIEDCDDRLSVANVIGPLMYIDCGRYLDILSDLHEENPDNQYLARRIIQCLDMNRYMGEFPGMDEWIENNPEKLVLAIKTLLKAKKGIPPAQLKRDMEVGIIDNPISYYSISMATTAMLMLDKKTFNKHFGNPDSMYFTKTAFLVGNYFKTKWAYRKNQEVFYEKHGRR